jgi:hypothetical protein
MLPLSRTARLDIFHVWGRVTPQADMRLRRRVLQVSPSLTRRVPSPAACTNPRSAGLPALQL